ncbi:MAG: hypothetical protein WBB45_09765 [Cyclobacteriaceae bacterium]
MNRTFNPSISSVGEEAKDSRFIAVSTLVLSVASLTLTYLAFIKITESGLGFTEAIVPARNSFADYAHATLRLAMAPGALIMFGLSMLTACAGVLLHYNWARVWLIYLSISVIFVSSLTTFCATLPGIGPIDKIWHDFGFDSTEHLTITSIVTLCTATFTILLIRKLRSAEFKEYFC